MTPERTEKFKNVAKRRQVDLTVVLENVHDPHNIGAVLRTCDSVGIREIFVLYTEEGIYKDRLLLGKRSSSGARKWVDVHYYTDLEACFAHIRRDYDKVFCTHLSADAVGLYEMDLTQSIALVMGNEKDGISEAVLAKSDGNFIIPQVGMVQSLNISVACAVTLYEAFRQRKNKGFYDDHLNASPEHQAMIFEKYLKRHEAQVDVRSVGKKG